MLTVRRMTFSFGVAIYFLLHFNLTHAAVPPDHQVTIQGTINSIDTSHNILVVDDMSYIIGNDLIVKTPTGKEGRLGLLYPGKRIRMDIVYSGSGTKPAIIHTIYMLR
jgi:hypothetical protein